LDRLEIKLIVAEKQRQKFEKKEGKGGNKNKQERGKDN
jgi:hypothetical protein